MHRYFWFLFFYDNFFSLARVVLNNRIYVLNMFTRLHAVSAEHTCRLIITHKNDVKNMVFFPVVVWRRLKSCFCPFIFFDTKNICANANTRACAYAFVAFCLAIQPTVDICRLDLREREREREKCAWILMRIADECCVLMMDDSTQLRRTRGIIRINLIFIYVFCFWCLW